MNMFKSTLASRLRETMIHTIANHIYITYGDLVGPDNTSMLHEEWTNIRNMFVSYGHCSDWSSFRYSHGSDLWKELNSQNTTKSFLEILYRIVARWHMEFDTEELNQLSMAVSTAISAYWQSPEVEPTDDHTTAIVMEVRFMGELTHPKRLSSLLDCNPWLLPLVFFSIYGGEIVRGIETILFPPVSQQGTPT